MAIGKKARDAVMERDEGRCQFFCGGQPATEISHKEHQGSGGLPASHWKNQPGNLAASCSECHLLCPPTGDLRWESYTPPTIDEEGRMADIGEMVIFRADGSQILKHELWHYRRWDKKAAELAAQHLHTVGEIDAPIGRMMHDLRRGVDLLDGNDGAEFDQYISSLGWDPLKANKIADVYEWASQYGGWPQEVNYSKMELLFDTNFGKRSPVSYIEKAKAGASYSDVRTALIKKGLRGAQPRNFLIITPRDLKRLWEDQVTIIRTRDDEKLRIEAAKRGHAVLTVNSIKGALKFKRGQEPRIVGDNIELIPLSLEDWLGDKEEDDAESASD